MKLLKQRTKRTFPDQRSNCLSSLKKFLLDDLDMKSNVDKSQPIIMTDEGVANLKRNVKTSIAIKPQLPSADGFRDPPPILSSLRNPLIKRKPFTNTMYGRSDQSRCILTKLTKQFESDCDKDRSPSTQSSNVYW
jgi:hypothetical protein